MILMQNVFKPWPLKDNSVQSIITSPPYYMCRNYSVPNIIIGGDPDCGHEFNSQEVENMGFGGINNKVGNGNKPNIYAAGKYWAGICVKCGGFKGQYGNEHLPFGHEHSYLEHTRLWLKEAWRVLRDDGIIYIIIDDKFSGSNMGSSVIGGTGYDYTDIQKQLPKDTTFGVKRKSLLLIPERMMIMMQEMGFVIRGKLVWIRTMPESCSDRFTSSFETIIFASKNPKYYFNLDAVREPIKDNTIQRYLRAFNNNKADKYKQQGGNMDINSQRRIAEKFKMIYGKKIDVNDNYNNQSVLFEDIEEAIENEDAKTMGPPRAREHRGKYNNSVDIEKKYRCGMHKKRGDGIIEKRPLLPPQKEFIDIIRKHFTVDSIVEKIGISRTTVEHWFRYDSSGFAYPSKEDWEKLDTDILRKELTTIIYETDEIGKTRIRNKVNKPPEETGILGDGGHYNYGGINSSESTYKRKLKEGNDAQTIMKNPGSVWLDYWLDIHRQLITKLGIDGYLDALKSQILSESDIFPPFIESLHEKHYAPFSSKLVTRLMLCSSRVGDVVLDPFVGSGTTVIVAEKLNRKGVGFDIGYQDIQQRRLSRTQKNLI